MKTGHINETRARSSFYIYRTDRNYFTWSRPGSEIFVCLAMYLTGLAANAAGIVVVQGVFAHFVPPFDATGLTCTIVSVMAQPPPAGSNS